MEDLNGYKQPSGFDGVSYNGRVLQAVTAAAADCSRVVGSLLLLRVGRGKMRRSGV